MIVYQLACEQGHFFEGWFASSQACEKQAAEGYLQCPTCSSPEVRKLPAAPYVRGTPSVPADAAVPDAQLRSQVRSALRRYLLANTDDVGRKFPEIARRIHYREAKPRNIRGQVSLEEALELHEEGVEAYAISPEVLPSEDIH